MFKHFPIRIVVVLAWRNLWRNARRSGIMLAAIVVGVWAMIFMTAMMRGMVEDMLVRGIENLPGHIQIHHKQYLDDPNVEYLLLEPNEKQLEVLNSSRVSNWYSRVKVPAVISSERESRGVILKGVDPFRERSVLLNNLTMIEGEFLAAHDDRGVLIGKKMADKLETRLGKRVVLLAQDPNNDVVEMGFRVKGIFKADLSSQEESQVFVAKSTAQKFLNISGKVSEIAVFGHDHRDTEGLSSLVSALEALSPEGFISVQSWSSIDAYLGSMVGLMDGFVLVWIVVIFLAMSFGLANTLVMAIFERVREIGLMLALGMRPGILVGQIILESVFLLMLGLLIGDAAALFSLQLMEGGVDLSQVAQGLEMMGVGTVLTPALLVNDMVMANIVVLVLGVLTCTLPAFRAAYLKPIEAINHAT